MARGIYEGRDYHPHATVHADGTIEWHEQPEQRSNVTATEIVADMVKDFPRLHSTEAPKDSR